MILLQIVTGALGVLVISYLLSAADPGFRLGVTVAAAVIFSLISQITLAAKKERFHLVLVVVPLFLFLAGIGGLGWYAQNSDPLRDDGLKIEKELLLTGGMIKDALYTVSLQSMERHAAGRDSLFAPEQEDTLNGYSLINGIIETPYNGTGIYLFLEYSGSDSMVVSGLSAHLTGWDTKFSNAGGYTGCLEYRATLTQKGVVTVRVN